MLLILILGLRPNVICRIARAVTDRPISNVLNPLVPIIPMWEHLTKVLNLINNVGINGLNNAVYTFNGQLTDGVRDKDNDVF